MPFLFPTVKATMRRFRDPDRVYKERVTILSVDVSASPGVKTVQYQAVVKPKTKGEKTNYTTTIRFHGIVATTDRRNTKHISLDQDGKTYYYEIPSVKRNPVQIKCTCSSFRFEFEKQDYDAGGLIGNWRRYKRKTRPAQRPPNARNPNPQGRDFVNALPDGGDEIVGYCKHIHALLQLLRKQDKVR